jgi:hypothetical protein
MMSASSIVTDGQVASFRRLRLIGRQGSDALPTLAGLLIKVMQQTCPQILADYLRTTDA